MLEMIMNVTKAFMTAQNISNTVQRESLAGGEFGELLDQPIDY